MARLRGESSNRLFEVFAEWGAILEGGSARIEVPPTFCRE